MVSSNLVFAVCRASFQGLFQLRRCRAKHGLLLCSQFHRGRRRESERLPLPFCLWKHTEDHC